MKTISRILVSCTMPRLYITVDMAPSRITRKHRKMAIWSFPIPFSESS